MAEDIFDIVNEFDEVISRAPRSEVHAKKLMHRAAHVLIFSGEGADKKILLQKRSMKKDLCAGKYTTSCSGHVDSGESYEIGVLRELKEETGISANMSNLNFIGKISPCPDTGWEFTAVYEMYADLDCRLYFSPDEIDSFKWQSISDFENSILNEPELFTPSFIRVYGFYLSKKK